MNSDLVAYYKHRAKEYEKIYIKPERQSELRLAEQTIQDIFLNKKVLEIACGTGYWTEKLSTTAHSIVATDINEAVIEIAKAKLYPKNNVSFKIADFFDLDTLKHESLFGGFIWSHITLQDLNHFISKINSLVESDGTVVLMDNNYVEGSSSAITETDSFGNTYQARQLEDGTSHKVLKNFPTKEVVLQLLAGKVREIEFINLKYYWILKYKTI